MPQMLPISMPLCYHNYVKLTRRQLFLYLVLNVLVSVCATAGVLFFYDQYYRPSLLPDPGIAGDPSANVEILAVVGTGIPTSEMVLIRNNGQGAAILKGWKLQDADGNTYTFGESTIQPGGAIQLHTIPGENTLIDFYWGLTAAAWSSGETVTLLDAAGAVKSLYKVP